MEVKTTDEMTFMEILDWARSEIATAVVEGQFRETMWRVVNCINSRAYKEGLRDGKSGK